MKTTITYPNGDTHHYLNEQLHRDDGPAYERKDGIHAYYQHGKLHRDDGPALVYPNNPQLNQYWIYGKKYSTFSQNILHNTFTNEDGIFIKHKDGRSEWYNKNNQLHRENDEPAIIYPHGTLEWYLNGKSHRENKPSIIYPDGTEEWHLNGQPHRLDAPAFSKPNGHSIWLLNGKYHNTKGPAKITNKKEYWLNGTKYPYFLWLLKKLFL